MPARRVDEDADVALALGRVRQELAADPLGHLHINLTENQNGARLEQGLLHRRHRLVGLHALLWFILVVVVELHERFHPHIFSGPSNRAWLAIPLISSLTY